MKKPWIFASLVLAGLTGGCRSGGRTSVGEQKPGADPLRQFVGQKMVLRHFGDDKTAVVKRGDKPSGGCDMAVQVAAAVAAGDSVKFTLDPLGRIRVGGNVVGKCGGQPTQTTLTAKGVDPARPDDWRDVLAVALLSPEAYLAANGRPLAFAPEPEPKLAASASATGDSEERRLGRRVTVWPKPVLSVEPAVRGSGKVKHEGELEFSAVVGSDGRVFRPELKTPLSDEHARYVATVLQVWRFEPAREGEKSVPARYEGRTVFKIY
jgi:hypothetical protein